MTTIISSLPFAVNADSQSKTLRPVSSEGDAFFGLQSGTNGTAATCRRALVQVDGYQWIQSTGRNAIGMTFVPGDSSESIEVGYL